MLFNIYSPISKKSSASLIRIFLNHIKTKFKEKNLLIDNIDFFKKKIMTLDQKKKKKALSHVQSTCDEACIILTIKLETPLIY